MKISVLLLFLLRHFAFSVKHSLKFIYVASSGVPSQSNIPEFASAALVDETLVGYCDTELHVKEDGMKSLLDNDPDQLAFYSYQCQNNMPRYFRTTIHNLKQRFNQSGGVHILQRVMGIEWDDETRELNGFHQYGYNGEDFISFDQKTSTWIAPSPQAFSTKLKWDADAYRQERDGYYLTRLFPQWLKMYIQYGNRTLMRTVLPSVSLLQKSPSSPITCHATGFYPNSAVLFWRKDGEELFEDVEHGEILPNQDGSFQMSVDLLKLPPEDWGKYECVFLLSGVKEDMVTKLEKNMIRTNYKISTDVAVAIGVGLPLLIVVIVAAVVGFVIYKKRKAT